MKDIHKQKGIIKVSRTLIFQEDNNEFLKLFFSNFYPIRIDAEYNDKIVFWCLSEHFEEIEEGTKTHEYNVIIEKTYGEEMKIKEIVRL